jgi:hypothetical protein
LFDTPQHNPVPGTKRGTAPVIFMTFRSRNQLRFLVNIPLKLLKKPDKTDVNGLVVTKAEG